MGKVSRDGYGEVKTGQSDAEKNLPASHYHCLDNILKKVIHVRSYFCVECFEGV